MSTVVGGVVDDTWVLGQHVTIACPESGDVLNGADTIYAS